MTAPIPVRVTRYQDPWCGRTHSSRRRAVEHMGRCWKNPDNRGCLTCRHHIDPWQAMGEEDCAAGVNLAGTPACPDCGGVTADPWNECKSCRGAGQEVKAGPIVHCDKWEEKTDD
ncbi:hypothetical protein [Actinoplanes rectilineatus]|uniref:hypothetical protein n=1 Tax=Actinoplanes rectilineatus TaxID=113571 RepID=UPI0005F2BA32|nr:hypothetical protein [Actinoplanes rectilineatus]